MENHELERCIIDMIDLYIYIYIYIHVYIYRLYG